MNKARSLLLAAAVVLAAAAAVSAQVAIQVRPNSAAPAMPPEREVTDDELIRSVFDPITDQLKLTDGQRFDILTIITATINRTEPFFEQLDALDNEITLAAFTGNLDDPKLKELSSRQATLVADINASLARAKMGFYKVLTPEQRSMVLAQYGLAEQRLGALSNVGP